jgi:two-component system response regulator HydG
VADGSFREDLYYRLKVVTLHVPPLRERPDDIAALARFFLRRHAERFGVSHVREPPGLMPTLLARPWPGNVRELENALEMLVALSPDGELDLGLLDDPSAPAPPMAGVTLKERVDAYERGLVAEALAASGGNKAEAARALGIGRVTLYEKLRRHGLS